MPRPRSSTLLALAAIGLGTLVAGCVPGDERPTVGTAPDDSAPVETLSREPTGVAEADALLVRLDGNGDLTFTAGYDITRKLGNLSRDATVVQDPPRTAVRIGDVTLFNDTTAETCSAATGTCEEGLLEQRISDAGVSSRFWGPATAQQLRVAVGRESGTPTTDTEQVAGLEVGCVHVPLGGGQETYCVTTDGIVALVDTAAVHIELTSYSPEVDASAFTRPN